MRNSRAEVNSGNLICSLTFIGAKIKSYIDSVFLVIPIDRSCPCRSPQFGILTAVPIDGILFAAFRLTAGKQYLLAILVQLVNLSCLGEPFTVFIHSSHGQHDVGVRISVTFIVNGKIYAHALGDKLFHAVISDKGRILLVRKLSRQCQDDAP